MIEEIEYNEETIKWIASRPIVIKEAIKMLPPNQLYKIKSTGQECFIHSYGEPESGKIEDVTISVDTTGIKDREGKIYYSPFGVYVFGLKVIDLEPWHKL